MTQPPHKNPAVPRGSVAKPLQSARVASAPPGPRPGTLAARGPKNRILARLSALRQSAVESDASWFHSVPAIGEYPGGSVTLDGKTVKGAVLVVDREAYDRILAAFAEERARAGWHGLLVDREHFSLDTSKPSDAMAWALEIREDADGLWTRWEFTPPGREAWESKVLVSRSPVMDLEPLGGKRFRPVRLESLAMTNTPHFDLYALAAARAAEEGAPPDGAQTQGDDMDRQLLDALGLPESATLDDALEAIKALTDAKAAADTAAAAAQTAARKAQCDAFIAAHKGAISDEAKFRQAYEANPDATEAAFGAFRAAPEKPPQRSRIAASAAGTPSGGTLAASRRRSERSAAVAACRAANPGMTCREAEAICRRQNPELFTGAAE